MQPVMKRHPRLAVLRWRLLVVGPVALFLLVALINALEGDWLSAVIWVCVVLTIRSYEQRLRQNWSWAWRAGNDAALRSLLPLVRLDEPGAAERLRLVLLCEPPGYQEELERRTQIDHEATMRATMEHLEEMLKDPKPGA